MSWKAAMDDDYKIEYDGALWHLYHKENGKWIKYPVGSTRKSKMYEQKLRIVDYGEEPWQ